MDGLSALKCFHNPTVRIIKQTEAESLVINSVGRQPYDWVKKKLSPERA